MDGFGRGAASAWCFTRERLRDKNRGHRRDRAISQRMFEQRRTGTLQACSSTCCSCPLWLSAPCACRLPAPPRWAWLCGVLACPGMDPAGCMLHCTRMGGSCGSLALMTKTDALHKCGWGMHMLHWTGP